MTRARVVIDTNVLVSAVLTPGSVPGLAYSKALDSAELVFNRDMLLELTQVLYRPKFDRYLQRRTRELYLKQFVEAGKVVVTRIPVVACRDARDNHILEAAVNGSAETIITGDMDLLDLHPFHGIKILAPVDYLQK